MSGEDTSEPPGTFRTVASELEHEPEKTKGSRHIARVARVRSTGDVEAVLDQVRERYSEANHHAFAYRLRLPPGTSRASDDGEPAGSAGAPILARLEGQDLFDVLVVVSRIFGGTKLGVGGLVRAYGGAASEALERAGVVRVVPRVVARLVHGYEDSAAVAAALHAADAETLEGVYEDRVELRVELPEHRLAALRARLVEDTAGRVDAFPQGARALR